MGQEISDDDRRVPGTVWILLEFDPIWVLMHCAPCYQVAFH